MDFFLMLSSVGGIIGNRSQGNYNVGNVFQDNLSYHRRSLGLPAFSLDLGVIWSMGYVAENRERTMFAKGRTDPVASLTEDEVLTLLDFGMDPRNNTPTQLVTGVANVAVYKQNGVSPPGYLGDPLFTHLTTQLGELFQSAATSSGPSIEVQLGAATTMKSAATVVEKAVCEKLSSQLAIPLPDIDLQQSIVSMGVDSLVAMELRAFFLRTLKADIPLLEITGMDSLKALCHKIATTSTAVTIADVIV
jgi:acyl carrier protein